MIGNIVGDSMSLCLGYADRLLADIPPDQFAKFAVSGGTTIESNHPAFCLGHLVLYAPKIVTQLGGTPSAIPENFESLFSKDAKCVDDPDGTIYPAMDIVVDSFRSAYAAALTAARNASDEQYAQPNPAGGRMTELFPTLGSMHAFYCSGHMMMHLGQVSAWRRAAGLGAA